MSNNTDGYANVGIGGPSLYSNTTGQQNMAIGGGLYSNIIGNSNSAFGYNSLNFTTGSYNTASGCKSLIYAVGDYNIGIGVYELDDFSKQYISNTISIGTNITLQNSNSGMLKYSIVENTSFPTTNEFWFGDPDNGWIDVYVNSLKNNGDLTVSSSSKSWIFNTNGDIILPEGGNILDSGGNILSRTNNIPLEPSPWAIDDNLDISTYSDVNIFGQVIIAGDINLSAGKEYKIGDVNILDLSKPTSNTQTANGPIDITTTTTFFDLSTGSINNSSSIANGSYDGQLKNLVLSVKVGTNQLYLPKFLLTNLEENVELKFQGESVSMVWNNTTSKWIVNSKNSHIMGNGIQSYGDINLSSGDLTIPSGDITITGNLNITHATAGATNLVFGTSAGSALANGAINNVIIGQDALNVVTTGDNNTAIGFEALKAQHATIGNNVAVGSGAGVAITTGTENVIIGKGAAAGATTSDSCVVIGPGTCAANMSGEANIVIGHNSGAAITIGHDNVVIGKFAGNDMNEGNQNIMLGTQAGLELTTGNNNIMMGVDAGRNIQTGEANIAIGVQALLTQNLAVSNNVAIGVTAGRNLTTGANNVMIGRSAASGATEADSCVVIGTSTCNAAMTGASNIVVGAGAGLAITTGNSNVMIGRDACASLDTGTSNTILGHSAGNTATTGSTNVCVGNDADVSGTGAVNQTAIGAGVTCQADNQVVLGNTSVTDVFMAQDKGATVHCGAVTASGVINLGNTTGSAGVLTSKIRTGVNNIMIKSQPAHTPNVGATAQFTAAQLASGFIIVTPTSDIDYIMPDDAAMLALFGGSSAAVGDSFTFTILNAETSFSKNCTLTGSDHTFIGNTIVRNSTPVLSALFLVRLTNSSTGVCTVYRLA